ncbi:branched-chain amino acid ABC transporter ATP-binding protein/permease [Methylobacterium sp. NEAU 140]|uniref:branched-chain amino acid ABC transporter ATP-binding protein/permease n=1 Tax=Methylobacterium sp. NEAU 140 TaxID=3064945 RepID=UPI0027359A93|nr:branched-chain amino acid ABC transporter ATP-binding protein/permease [Methylobacterium sp. NEAU 140]MDP4026153.1 branched-chain amino acid ABC transporter ATP-binding protein/permease [Methylobacterium sp. NEAU 140]
MRTIQPRPRRAIPVEVPILAAGLALAGLALAQPLGGYATGIAMQAATCAIAVLGLTIVLGYAGQITLAQASFFGLGAYAVALGTADLGLSFWTAFLMAVAVSAAAGVALGLTSVRLGGHYLAMVTITFQQIFTLVLTNWAEVTHGPDGVPGIPRPELFGHALSDTRHYLAFSLVCLTLAVASVSWLRRTALGRAMEALRDNELAASVNGIDTVRVKVIAFALCATLGGIGGALFASGFAYISPDQFSLAESIVFLTMALLGGVKSALGTLVGASLLIVLPEVLRFLKEVYLAVYGAAVVLIMIFMPDGIWGWVVLFGDRLVRRGPQPRTAGPLRLRREAGDPGDVVLEVRNLAKTFGGLKALDSVDLEVRRNTIHALIGPNGSGKTTFVNVLSGLYRPSGGRIRFGGRDATARAPHVLSGRGLARTFQNIRLFRSMTCLDNVMVGAQRPGNDLSAEGGGVEARALSALDFVGLLDRADALVGDLPYGHQRKVEIARALAADPALLLLDEPAAGLNTTEKGQLVELLRRLKGLGLTILIIEHDMPLVEAVADQITVLNFGQRISDGTPAEVLRDPAVVTAYLGEAHVRAAA